MAKVPQAYLRKIRQFYPKQSLGKLELNREGLVNDVVILDGELVCRFPKHAWAEETLLHEARVLEVVGRHTDVPVPRFEMFERDFASYRFLPGVPITRSALLQLSATARSDVLTDALRFVRALHEIPTDELEHAGIGPSATNRDLAWWLEFYADLEQYVFPYLMRHQRVFVEEHFAPVVSGEIELGYEPCLVHGDLAPYHLLFDNLFDNRRSRLAGVIDFGTAGLGDPAVDIAVLLYAFGESLLVPVAEVYPGMPSLLERARFWAGTFELQWALHGIRNEDREFMLAHVGSGARDLLPPGFPPYRLNDAPGSAPGDLA